ncbi:ABC-type transport auxiliary lipoprotein family protein [Magnetospirillum sp. UT-4]|uniref:ABC-type transport auxiliary lipoprotein family protein n=1 Tax=Magnetospirillum sp. UT-4 TaxID=2681467 RepID=UPI00137F4BC0|nr:ABC-type transport auxiliary lipoprotein family protein [Magnetospirillum sp. UT-4]CAA7614287.1 conserved exported hypothetical protein [Magnetospirillum sp. UT-4]
MRIPSVILALSLALAACASPAPPEDNFYRLDGRMAVQRLAAPVLPGVLEVNRLDSDGVLSERALAYQDSDGTLARYRYDLWSEAPGALLQERLVEALRAANAAVTVLTPDLRVPPDWTLRGKLKRFELLPDAGKVMVRLELAVVSARDGSLVLLRTYETERRSEAAPKAAAVALAAAADEAIARFVADLGTASVPAPRR